MAIHKLQLEDFDQVDYELIAIHTSLEDYRLAFKINQQLEILLSKNKNEIPIEKGKEKTYFSRYTFEDEAKMMSWNLIQNKQEIKQAVPTATFLLFDEEIMTTVNLLNELKKVDYLLKIEHENQIKIKDLLQKIKKIEAISAVYEVDTNEIKSKNNLIF